MLPVRILKPGGTYMCLSSGIPSEVMKILSNQDFSWLVECIPVVKPVISEVVLKVRVVVVVGQRVGEESRMRRRERKGI